MKRLLLVLMFFPLLVLGQRPGSSSVPTVLSVGDILPNYSIDTLWVNDTAGIMNYLAGQPQDYVALTNLCVSIRTRVQQAIKSIENDYDHRDSLIWIDSSTVLSDYSIYEFRLRRLADLMGRMSIKYSRMEQQRIEEEKEAARKRALEEARRQQEERNQMAADLRSSITVHHRSIISACDGAGLTDRTKLKNLKDLYYSYLMVYNKYDLSPSNVTSEGIAKLDELNAFQTDLLENVLGQNSLPYQIENFKNILKVRCEKDNSDIYRSYSKVFKHTTVPVSFADIKEYNDYINRLRTVINIQQRYMQTIDLRATIASGSAAIEKMYGKKYRNIVSAYRDVERTVNMVPAFTTNAESLLFIQGLEEFAAAQQRYLAAYGHLEEIGQRSDTIMARSTAKSYTGDVAAAYRDVAPMLIPTPMFSNTEGANHYDDQLEASRQVQQCYLEVLDLRRTVAANEDSIVASRKVDRTLANGYRDLRKQSDYTAFGFVTLDDGQRYIGQLRSYIEMQRLCLAVADKLKTIENNRESIGSLGAQWRNITKSYSRMEKVYRAIDDIGTLEDLNRYSRQCDAIVAMQQAYMALLKSDLAEDTDARLKRENDVEKIKLIIGVD